MTAARRRLGVATTLAALALLGLSSAPAALASPTIATTTVATGGGHGQDTCPQDDGWKKFDDLTGLTYVAKADPGYVIDAYCVKSSTTVAYETVSPATSEVTVTTPSKNKQGVQQNISHVTIHEVKQDDFTWDWPYAAPTCKKGVTVDYPADLPAGQANDVNVTVTNLETGEQRTFNFHKDQGTWTGTQHFNPADAENWPGWKQYAYTWVQVAGTNYHWQDQVECGCPNPATTTPAPTTTTTPAATEETTAPAEDSTEETPADTPSGTPDADSTTPSEAPTPDESTPDASQLSSATSPAATPEATTVVLAAGGTATPSADAASSAGDLAETGANVLPYVIGAVLLVAAGATLVVVRRRTA
ncbi:hypothetical protein ACFT5B_17320 [Luteimicrobium sp. NPDC057192]|uniref:hypothetical protein n=1 Tax=Luteimicrobium sp. NPDC057192 TaxID=3346042 RepID=UPI00364350AC